MIAAMAHPGSKPPRRSTFLRTLRTVGAAMFGVRGRNAHENDGAGLSPVAILVVALVFAILFIGGLVTLATSIAAR